jgi:hypothetical protein
VLRQPIEVDLPRKGLFGRTSRDDRKEIFERHQGG